MTYEQAIRFIIERSGWDKGFVANPFLGDDIVALGLRRTAGIAARLGNPQRALRIIHIAGTKGKGSTGAMIAAVARAAGLSTGVYSQPHLHTFRERILIDDVPVSEPEFAALADAAAVADTAMQREEPELGEATAFEVSTVMALLAFARATVDLAVVEVGLGGRLDATNIVDPAVTVITSISYDHTAILGNTLTEIATEKGGIIKPGVPVVIAPQLGEAQATLERIAAERGAPTSLAGRDWSAEPGEQGARLVGPWGDWVDVQLALAGGHQVENAGTALMALYQLHPALLADEQRVRAALRDVRWPGRLELVHRSPDIWVDGAHNVDSTVRMVAALRAIAGSRPVTVVLGIGRDKDIAGIVRALAPLQPQIVATASHNPRAAEPEQIAQAAQLAGLDVVTAPSVAEALETLLESAPAEMVICVTGSLYTVAEAREAMGLAETPVFERSLLFG